jgi:prepilin-type N-terminal cleavage/methylation domain-containing protein
MARTPRRSRRGNRQAFSLLEAVLVLAILAVLAATAAPRYAQAVARYRADCAARTLANDLDIARQRARTLGARQTVTFSTAANSYEIVGLNSLDGTGAAYRVNLRTGPNRAELFSAVFGTGSTLVFDGFGLPDNGGSAVVRVGDVQKTVCVDAATGRAKVQ